MQPGHYCFLLHTVLIAVQSSYDVIRYYAYIKSAVHETCLIDLQASNSNILQHLATARGATCYVPSRRLIRKELYAWQHCCWSSNSYTACCWTAIPVCSSVSWNMHVAIPAMNERTVPRAGGSELERVVIVLPAASRFPAKSLSFTCQSSFTL